MELDKRIDDKRVKLMTCFNTDEAKQYVGQKGYFADRIHPYQDLDKTYFGTLDKVDDDEIPFKTGRIFYQFFLPAEFVRPVEEKKKNWRPFFTTDEFRAKFPLLSPVTYREKKKQQLLYSVRYWYWTWKEWDRACEFRRIFLRT